MHGSVQESDLFKIAYILCVMTQGYRDCLHELITVVHLFSARALFSDAGVGCLDGAWVPIVLFDLVQCLQAGSGPIPRPGGDETLLHRLIVLGM